MSGRSLRLLQLVVGPGDLAPAQLDRPHEGVVHLTLLYGLIQKGREFVDFPLSLEDALTHE